MKYLVKTHCLEWHNVGYIIEAESPEEASEIVEDTLSGDIYYDDFDVMEQIDIESVTEYED